MEFECVGVAGLGLLGRGIAACLLAHGLRVVAFDLASDAAAEARSYIAAALEELRSRGLCEVSIVEDWQTRYSEAQSLEAFAACDFVIESIIEAAEAKAALFDQLESIIAPDVTVASNTSALPISLLQSGRRHPERFVGMHWAEPAHATRFLELIRGEQTAGAPMQTAIALAEKLGKEPCVVERDIPGFIANRLGYAMYREACHLLATGVADAETIDTSFRNSVGLWASICGPFRWIDLTGGPALYARAMQGVLPTLSRDTEMPEPLATMMNNGLTGVRDGEGFYAYTPEQAAHWEEIYRRHVWRVREAVDESFPRKSEASSE
jgi:3-hydroxybutyryl-CoA dehydrogenase